MPKLKVYRTSIGFHDAYVAAPSQKAALAAWGAGSNLFARGEAELVEDASLAEEPLAHPGKVIKRSRGSTVDHLAALPADRPKARAKTDDNADRKPRRATAKAGAPPTPRPSRTALDKAEEALERAIARRDAGAREFKRRQAELDEERHRAEQAADAEISRREQAREHEKAAYDRAIKAWRG
ncbi:hypothetical protein [Sphingomonas quercus]|uniref:Cell envelope biogenesis protein TolA n=1 Tax=Sphingomonas quercus TaxID=2842451 RepID=A0ABS6BLT2_9SPHN|nr:hypothetical protein [Sphingomonas quercus]MBU3079275.1 hypothetical protein [Sphingomonas quercus]